MKCTPKLTCLLSCCFLLTTCSTDSVPDSTWKNKDKAIICLTYDDGMETQYKNAIPQLDEFGLKGTFFINNVSGRDPVVAWRNASKNGHELGNHTLFHPCPSSVGWPKEVTSDYYTVDLILEEISAVNAILNITELEDRDRAFAYPCNSMTVGNKSYKEALKKSGLVTYARNGTSKKVIINIQDPAIDFMNIPSWSVAEGTDFSTLKAYVDQTIEAKGIGIFQFHGIGGEWLSISKEDHYQLLEYLKEKEDVVLVSTFSEAMGYLAGRGERE